MGIYFPVRIQFSNRHQMALAFISRILTYRGYLSSFVTIRTTAIGSQCFDEFGFVNRDGLFYSRWRKLPLWVRIQVPHSHRAAENISRTRFSYTDGFELDVNLTSFPSGVTRNFTSMDQSAET